jgi:hypothetical protein
LPAQKSNSCAATDPAGAIQKQTLNLQQEQQLDYQHHQE